MENLLRYKNFSSELVRSRNIDVWLPPDYDPKRPEGYPVFYMHDGQNLFIPELSYTGITWEVAPTLTRLISEGAIEPVIVVGIWNTPQRFPEYMPASPEIGFPESVVEDLANQEVILLSDQYLEFIVNELKPEIDSQFNTRTDRESTFTIGASMGGLISLYALVNYPDIFGGAGCVSTHWPVGHTEIQDLMADLLVGYFTETIFPPEHHRIYFDYGTDGLDSLYENHQLKMDAAMAERGYVNGSDLWLTLKFEGADHSEDSWRKRFDGIATFLLSPHR